MKRTVTLILAFSAACVGQSPHAAIGRMLSALAFALLFGVPVFAQSDSAAIDRFFQSFTGD